MQQRSQQQHLHIRALFLANDPGIFVNSPYVREIMGGVGSLVHGQDIAYPGFWVKFIGDHQKGFAPLG
jgi:hypothetical protein